MTGLESSLARALARAVVELGDAVRPRKEVAVAGVGTLELQAGGRDRWEVVSFREGHLDEALAAAKEGLAGRRVEKFFELGDALGHPSLVTTDPARGVSVRLTAHRVGGDTVFDLDFAYREELG